MNIKSLILTISILILGMQPMSAQSADESVILINPFVVPEGSQEDAVEMWKKARDFLATQPGYISTKLHRAISPDATYSLINVAKWESMEAFRAATGAMRKSASIPRIEGVKGDPQLYTVIAE